MKCLGYLPLSLSIPDIQLSRLADLQSRSSPSQNVASANVGSRCGESPSFRSSAPPVRTLSTFGASRLSMSGPITLEGKVLAVEGVEEKLKAAKKGGVKKVFLPEENHSDVENLDIDIVYVSKYEDIFNSVFK